MGEIVPDKQPKAGLPTVRRFEAAGFRAWPAAAVHYDGTWVDQAHRRPPGQAAELGQSARSGRRQRDLPSASCGPAAVSTAYGRPLTFRLSPLAGEALVAPSRQRGLERVSANRW